MGHAVAHAVHWLLTEVQVWSKAGWLMWDLWWN